MNILFLIYWGLNDGLTASTVLPHIKILERNEKIKKIVLVTIERDVPLNESRFSDKVFHIPWVSSHRYSAKVRDFTALPRKIVGVVKKFNIQFMFCRGTPAGAIGYLVNRKIGIQYAVESFEPHADYMHESGVWARWDPRYILQRYWEKRQLETARYLLPVSQHYHDYLIERKIDRGKLFTMPCAVDLQMFAFSRENRLSTRRALGVADDVIVGIYVGKFGGMYFDREAFQIFAFAKNYFDRFYLVILSPDERNDIATKLQKAGYLPKEFSIKRIGHTEVPPFLSASDFAFATYKPGYFKRYLSPVKVGEYWAAGLPVLLTDGVGDDHAIIEKLKIGSVFSLKNNELENAFLKLRAILEKGRVSINEHIQPVAVRHRNFSQNEMIYNTIIDNLS
jgi:glycosyltransferase involved in cell wall biosynthesis